MGQHFNEFITIGEIADVKGGKRLPKGMVVTDEETEHPYLRVVDFANDGIDRSSIKFIDDLAYEKIKRYTISSNDVYISIAGTIGRVGNVPHDLSGANLTENAAKITNIKKLIDKKFLIYYLRSHFGQSEIVSKIVGTSQPKLALFRIQELKIPKVNLHTQRKIATILSNYDDLIENNLRRIKILEEMAQNLYREWFVNFRFPGHENTRFVDSPLGKVPEGWEVKNLKDISKITMGQSPKSEFYNSSGLGLPFHQGVANFGRRFPTTINYCTIEKRIANKGDILFSVRAPVGRINIADTKLIIGRGLSAIRHYAGWQWFLYHLLCYTFNEEDTIGGGTIFKSVTKRDMEQIKLLYPQEKIIKKFEAFVLPMEKQIETYEKKNIILRQTRDLLLPKLLSGEVDVSELDIKVPEEVAI